MYLIKAYKEIYNILVGKNKFKFIKIQIIALFTSFLEAIGILSIIPYVIFLEQFETIKNKNFEHEWINNIFVEFSSNEILILASLIIFTIFISSNIIIILSNKYYINFSRTLQQEFAKRLINFYLSKNLEFINKKKTNSILFNILSGAARSVNSVIYPAILIVSRVFVSFIIICVLAITNPLITTIILLVFGSLFYTFVKVYNKQIKTIASKIYDLSKERQESAKQAIDNYLDTVFFGKDFIIKNFLKKNFKYLHINSKNEFLSFLPKYVLEIFAFGTVALIIPLTIYLEKDVSLIMPIIILYVVSGYKLMPTIQSIYGSAILIKTNLKLFKDVSHDLILEKKEKKYMILDKIESINISNLSFSYNPKKKILSNINLNFKKGEIIGISGPSGSGKSTLGLIICGLLKNYKGRILINKKLYHEKINPLLSSISYINSSVNIFNLTFKENILFTNKNISNKNFEKNLKNSQLLDFFLKDIKKNKHYLLSQDKINLSTGQKQRLGISRINYKNADLLVLDEATNGLDSKTEDKILKYLKMIAKNKIIIIISHKSRTLKICDKIIKLKNYKAIPTLK
jgi:ATP-binding cassette, subfamily B, bacterial PglK